MMREQFVGRDCRESPSLKCQPSPRPNPPKGRGPLAGLGEETADSSDYESPAFLLFMRGNDNQPNRKNS